MMHLTAPDLVSPGTVPSRARLDRAVLVGNLVSGALWLVVLAVLASWPLALIGAAYVVVASVFLTAVYHRDNLSRKQEALSWAVPWLAAVALVAALLALVEGGGAAGWGLALYGGFVFATPCYLVWQLSALAVRQARA